MRQYHGGDLVIVDEFERRRAPCGIVTDRDIVVGVVTKGLDPDALMVGRLRGRNWCSPGRKTARPRLSFGLDPATPIQTTRAGVAAMIEAGKV